MGNFIDNNLIPGEKIIYKSVIHWLIYLPGIFYMSLGIGAYVLGLSLDISNKVSAICATLFVMVGAWMWIKAYLHRNFTEIAITDSRLIAKFGFIRRDVIELPLAKIESVTVTQSIFERIIDAGSVAARGTGMAMAPVRYIDSPIEFRNKLNAAISEAKVRS